MQVQHHLDNPSEHEVYNYELFIVDEILKEYYNISLCNILGTPQSIIQWVVHHQNPLIVKQPDWNHEDFICIVNERVPHFNSQQSIVYQKVLSSVNEHSGVIFFLNRPIGIGETYVYNSI